MPAKKKTTGARSGSAKSSSSKSSSTSRSANASGSKSKTAPKAATKPASKKAAKSTSSARTKSTVSSTTKNRATATSKRGTKATSPKTKTTPRSSASKPAKKKTRSNSKGIIASAIDAVTGMFKPGSPDAIELLKTDHDKVEELFAKVKDNEDGNNKTTFTKIKQELDVHAHIEETIFYPHLLEKGDKELKKIVREGLEEHTQVKVLLVELAELLGDSPTFKAKLKVLMENIEHHVEEEEDEMFPMVEDQIPVDMIQRLGSLMLAEKAKVGKMKTAPNSKAKASAASSR